ncbi:MAG: putative DNA binding domain-containing protein, partial [Candidatus Aminicenantes bacterium]|nr:putative DNA binding domain-containing protein [Candidatus Aminicenantes bacterium]
MKWLDILQRIETGEDPNTEFKRGVGDLSAIGKAICAFANGDGGLIVLGVDDSGTIVGVNEDPDALQERLTSFLHTGCSKPVTGVCGFQATASGRVHWVHVRRHQRGYDPFSYSGRFWIRRGRASVAPSPSELQELLNTFGLVFTENQVVPTATVQDLDLDAFHSFMRAQGKDTEEEPQPEIESDLHNAGVAEDFDGAVRPTLYGLMAFGKNPQAHPHTTNLFIQCAAYKGKDRGSDVVLVGESKGRLVEQVRRTGDWVRSLGWRERYHDFIREDIPIIPNNILREVLVNAVIHRDYAITGS